MDMDHSAVVVSISCGNNTQAVSLSKKLVEANLVACAQLFPIQSIYHWDGAVQNDQEVMIQAKTLASKLEALEELVVEEHDYDVPEIIATPIIWGHSAYLDWIEANTKENQASKPT